VARREIAVGLALGGGRVRLLRHLLTESLVLAACGGAFGLFLASWSLDLVARLVPATGQVSFTLDSEIDRRVLAFTAPVAMLSAVLTGRAQAVRALRAVSSAR
jgi:ABC-type antimicrobial peptide transport system permease subunit